MTEKTITIEYARHILGKKAVKMTDEQINDLLTLLRALSNRTIDFAIRDKE